MAGAGPPERKNKKPTKSNGEDGQGHAARARATQPGVCSFASGINVFGGEETRSASGDKCVGQFCPHIPFICSS